MNSKKKATAVAIDHKGSIIIAYSDKTQLSHILGLDSSEDERLIKELFLAKKLNFLSIIGPTEKNISFITNVTKDEWFEKANFFKSFNYRWKDGNEDGRV